MGKNLDRIIAVAAPFLASSIIRGLRLTMRLEFVNCDAYRGGASAGRQMIFAFWHGRLLMMPYFYSGKAISILVSQSRDGELIARTVKSFGMDSVRGSTTRGFVSGIKGLMKAAKAGRDIAITPDGPKGPSQKAQMGAVQLARATGLPIVPLTFGASKKKLSRAGMDSYCPILFPGGSSCAASL
ncbi:MAG: DUF374 domain-containing protein [Deltaproteobacteria bacterium]|nr:DUF374 domain-containing protein [Deltaproteobacteria bacterium]